MAFPSVIYLRYGDEKKTAASALGGLPWGSRGITQDGREFMHACAQTSAALAAGQVVVAGSTIPDHGCGTAAQLAVAAAAAGATTLVITAGGTTAIATDYYAGGEVSVRSGTSQGYVYKVKSNNSAATGSTCTVTLEPADPVVTAISASSKVGLRRHPASEVLTRAAGSAQVGPVVGVPVVAVSAGYSCWLLTKGVGEGLVAGTVAVIGQPVYASTELAGAVAGFAVASTGGPVYNEVFALGQALDVAAASTQYAKIMWNIG